MYDGSNVVVLPHVQQIPVCKDTLRRVARQHSTCRPGHRGRVLEGGAHGVLGPPQTVRVEILWGVPAVRHTSGCAWVCLCEDMTMARMAMELATVSQQWTLQMGFEWMQHQDQNCGASVVELSLQERVAATSCRVKSRCNVVSCHVYKCTWMDATLASSAYGDGQSSD